MRRGSMEFVAGSPILRRRIALEKLGGHVAAMTFAMLIVAFVAMAGRQRVRGPARRRDRGRRGPRLRRRGMGLSALAAGAIAFALAPVRGARRRRGHRRGHPGRQLARLRLPRVDARSSRRSPSISWFSWTSGHRPIAGIIDWASLLPLLGITLVAGCDRRRGVRASRPRRHRRAAACPAGHAGCSACPGR